MITASAVSAETVAPAAPIAMPRSASASAGASLIPSPTISLAAMGVAAAGYLPPVAGALFQEVIDLAVIINALRALRG